mgnify:FL=1
MILDQAGSQLFYHRDQKNLEFVDSDQIYEITRIYVINIKINLTC